jgi:hypothetical protein
MRMMLKLKDFFLQRLSFQAERADCLSKCDMKSDISWRGLSRIMYGRLGFKDGINKRRS